MNINKEYQSYYSYILEANGFERSELYKQYNTTSVDDSCRLVHVGNIGGMVEYPVWITIGIDQFNSHRYITIEASGVYSDWNLIKEWLSFHFKDAKLIDCNDFNQIIDKSRGL